jgi:hypothetical protein
LSSPGAAGATAASRMIITDNAENVKEDMIMKLVPLSDRVVLKEIEAEEKTASGIVLPGQAKEKPQQHIHPFFSFFLPCAAQ